MSKLLYITEEQLQEIVGNGSYLDPNDPTNEHRLGSVEVSPNGVTGDYIDGNIKFGEPVITDKIAKELSPKTRGFSRYTQTPKTPQSVCIEHKHGDGNFLSESNKDLTGKQKTFQISQGVIDVIKQNLNNYTGDEHAPGVKRGQNIIKNGRVSYDDAYRILNDISNGKDSNLLNTDGKLEREIRRKLDTAENISSNDKENKKEMGLNIIKPHSKDGTKGGAHSPKDNNVIGVTYF